jgi:hypothetical protein
MKKFLKVSSITLGILLIMLASLTAANWSVQNHANNNLFQTATFGMTITNHGLTAEGLCGAQNWAPGDDPVVCKVDLSNDGSIPINVVWSNMTLKGDAVMLDTIQVIDIADSADQTHMSDMAGYDTNGDGVYSLREAGAVFANAYYANPNGLNGFGSTFIAAHSTGWVSITLKFPASAGNDTINKMGGFDWLLTGIQSPKNP